MKVFGSNFLEPIQESPVLEKQAWNWEPSNSDVKKIYASGSKTTSRSSTYAAEKDSNQDTDRPNEGA